MKTLVWTLVYKSSKFRTYISRSWFTNKSLSKDKGLNAAA